MKIFFLLVLTIFSTKVFSQQKPSDRSFASELNKTKAKQQAVYKMIKQNRQMTGWNYSSQYNDSSTQQANTYNKTNSTGTNVIQTTSVSKENPQLIRSKPSSRPIQFPQKLPKTGSER